MNRGYVKMYRKTTDSTIFAHEGMFKLFCLCLMKATHKEIEVMIPGILLPIKLLPGQFITGRYSLHEDYHQAHIRKRYGRKDRPALKTLVRWLQSLEKMQILTIKSTNKYSIITVLNWNVYQDVDHQVTIKRPSNDHIQTQGKHNKETPDFFSLLERYSDHNLIDRVFQAIASTRKSGKVADSVLTAQLQKWERYPVGQVEAGIRTYLDKDHAGGGKREEYLLGIIRNQNGEQPTPQPMTPQIDQPSLEELYE